MCSAMKLDRNINTNGMGKYALIKLRVAPLPFKATDDGVIVPFNAVDTGGTPDTDFFVIRLKDKYAAPALHAYATAVLCDAIAGQGDVEYGIEIRKMAFAAQHHNPKHMPD